MVELSQEGVSITTDRSKIIAFIILQRQSEVVSAIEDFEGMRLLSPRAARSNKVKSSILGLWFQVKSNIRFSGKPSSSGEGFLFDELLALFSSSDSLSYEDFLFAFDLIDKFLCDANLTRFIYKRDYDMSSPVDEDEAKGL